MGDVDVDVEIEIGRGEKMGARVVGFYEVNL